MGNVNEQYARAAGVSSTAHIDGLKKGDDKMPKVEETEVVDPEAALEMSASSITIEDPESND